MTTENNVLVVDLSTEGLESAKHRIIGISVKSEKEEQIFAYRDERLLLVEFWNYLKKHKFSRIVGYNSDYFDIPFLVVRSILNGVDMLELKGVSCDVRRILFRNQKAKGKLSDFKHIVELPENKKKYSKMHMSLLWDCYDLPDLQEFLLEDVRITYALYQKVKEAGLVA